MSASQTDDEDYDESVLVDEDQDVDVEARAATAEGTEPEAASYSYDAHDTVRNLSWDEDLMPVRARGRDRLIDRVLRGEAGPVSHTSTCLKLVMATRN